jgi:hypothetical protein
MRVEGEERRGEREGRDVGGLRSDGRVVGAVR